MATNLTPKHQRTAATFVNDVGPLLVERIGDTYTADARYQDWLAEYMRGQAPYQIVAHVPKKNTDGEADTPSADAATSRGW